MNNKSNCVIIDSIGQNFDNFIYNTNTNTNTNIKNSYLVLNGFEKFFIIKRYFNNDFRKITEKHGMIVIEVLNLYKKDILKYNKKPIKRNSSIEFNTYYFNGRDNIPLKYLKNKLKLNINDFDNNRNIIPFNTLDYSQVYRKLKIKKIIQKNGKS